MSIGSLVANLKVYVDAHDTLMETICRRIHLSLNVFWSCVWTSALLHSTRERSNATGCTVYCSGNECGDH